MKILILEDEDPAYNIIIDCLQNYFNAPITHDRVGSNIEGKKLLIQNTYDFILSDIKLLDGISFDLFEEIKTNTPIIFCSAYDNYLIRAFKTNGIAYILKPYSQEDFNSAIDKCLSLCKNEAYSGINTDTISILKNVLNDTLKIEDHNYKKRFIIKTIEGIELIDIDDVTLIQADGDNCIFITDQGIKFNMTTSLNKISNQLNPKYFFKINRSEIVNIKFIKKIKSHTKNRLFIGVVGLNFDVLTSTSTTAKFRKWLEY